MCFMTETIGRSQVPVRPQGIIDAVQRLMSETHDLGHRAMLTTYLRHIEAEFSGDVDLAMSTLVAEPVFRFWCGFRDPDEPVALPRPIIRRNYARVFAGGFPPIEIVPERVIVSDDGLVLEGEQHSIVPGSQLVEQGVAAFDDAKDYYLVCRFALLIEFQDGLMVGEDHYWPLPFRLYEIVEDA
jgi:hypothetical protein